MEIKLSGFQCQKCGHQWKPRKPGAPARCAACKSPYWNRPHQGEITLGQASRNKDREGFEPMGTTNRGNEHMDDFLAGLSSETPLISALQLLDKRVQKLENLLEELHDLVLAGSQAYYWTPEWQAKERRADEDARLGRSKLYASAEELIRELNG